LAEEGVSEALVALLCNSPDQDAREAACQALAHLIRTDPRVCGFLLDFGASGPLIFMLASTECASFFFRMATLLSYCSPFHAQCTDV